MIVRHTAWLVAVVTVLASPLAAEQSASSWIVRGATIIDGTGAPAATGSVLVGRGERIVCVGDPGRCAIPAEARVLDATGKWVVPGLIDTHVHLDWSNLARAERVQRIRFAFGITTTREAGAVDPMFQRNVARRQLADDAAAPEPRLIVSALVPKDAGTGSSSDDVARVIRRLVDAGAQAIKTKSDLESARLESIVAAAHAAGVPVFGHTWAPGGSHLERALAAGIDGLSHMTTFSMFGERPNGGRPAEPVDGVEFWVWNKELWLYQDETRLSAALDLIAAKGAWIEPMLVTERYITLPYPLAPRLAYLDGVKTLYQVVRPYVPYGSYGGPAVRDRQRRLEAVFARMCTFLTRFHARGGVIVAGTDDAQPGPALSEEVRLLSSCGIGPMAAIEAATRHAASAVGAPDIGTLEPGKLADLVVLDADPLADASNLTRVWRVMKGGHVHDPASLLVGYVRDYEHQSDRTWMIRGAAGVGLAMIAAGGLALGRRRFAAGRRPEPRTKV